MFHVLTETFLHRELMSVTRVIIWEEQVSYFPAPSEHGDILTDGLWFCIGKDFCQQDISQTQLGLASNVREWDFELYLITQTDLEN